MRQFLLILGFCLALLLASPLSATSYFVTQSGAGSQNGLSLANAWSVAAYNANSANSGPTGGDTVLFSGTITSPISISTSGTGNGTGRLTLDFSGATLNVTSGNVINLNSNNFITLNGGLILANNATQITGKLSSGSPETGHDITVQNFTFTGPTTGTPDFYINGLYSNVLIVNNTVDNVSHCVNAYQGFFSNMTIRNNFCRTSLDTTTDDDVIQISDAANVTIEGNKLINRSPSLSSCCHNDVIQTYSSGGGSGHHPTSWIIRYNWIETAQQQSGGSGTGVQWTEMQQFAGQPALQMYGNVFVGTGVSQGGGNGISIHSGTNATDTYYFYNNTLWDHGMPLNPLRLGEGDGPGTVFINNNAGGNDTTTVSGYQVTFTAGAPFDRNFFYQYTNCTSAVAGPNGSCSLSPSAFTNTGANDFTLPNGSPLMNAGDSTIGATYNQGICPGATWPNPALCARIAGAWDVGAYQNGTTTAVNPPTGLTAVVH